MKIINNKDGIDDQCVDDKGKNKCSDLFRKFCLCFILSFRLLHLQIKA